VNAAWDSSIADPYYYGKRQVLFAAIGLVAAFVVVRFPLRAIRSMAWPAVGISLVLLGLTAFPQLPFVVEVNGNSNWLRFGPSWTQFQPSEFAKLALVVFAGDHLARKERRLGQANQWLPFMFVSFLIVFIVAVLQRDMGTGVVMAAMVMIILLAGGAPWRLLISSVVVGSAAVVALVMSNPSRRARLIAFFDPSHDVTGTNLQSLRGSYAMATGGWWGEGLGASKQKWGLLSEAHTDYIFAIIGEELGLVGTLTILGCFVVLAYAGFRVVRTMNQALLTTTSEGKTVLTGARRQDVQFCRHAACGVVSWITVQALINMAVVLGCFPVMGVPLPLVSYGGSSLIAVLMGLGLLVACARREPDTVAWVGRHRRAVADSQE
jgi:cell division protein FtsW